VLHLLVFVNLLLSLMNLAFAVAFARILVQLSDAQEKPKAKPESHLVDLPMRYENQHNYTDLPQPKSTDLQIIHKA
jgi:hypothetical protein